MAITKERKQDLIRVYVDLLGNSQAIVFVYARGLSVAEITQLRSKIRETGAAYHVVKNTLFKRALTQAGMPVPEFLTGPVSVAFCVEDIASTVKAILDFSDELDEREFEITGGVVRQDVLDAAAAKKLSSLPSKETLIAQLLAVLQAPHSELITALQGPATELTGVITNVLYQIVSLLQVRADQLEKGQAAP